MRIEALVETLQRLAAEYPGAIVDVRNRAGEWDTAGDVVAKHYGMGHTIGWLIFIDN